MTDKVLETVKVEGNGGAVNLTSNPQIEAPAIDGVYLLVIGKSNTNTVRLDHGDGLDMNGFIVLKENQNILFKYITDTWVEISRSDR